VVLAGCTTPIGDAVTTGQGPTAATDADTTTTTTDDGDATTTTTTDDDDATTTDPENDGDEVIRHPDPPSDRLGWEAGIWYNETIGVTNDDGMNETERRLAVARAMARIELVRETEVPGNRTVPVEVRSREAFKENQTAENNYTESYRTFDNVKFEAMLFVDDSEDAIAVQNRNRGSSVAGYYSPSADSMVLISESNRPQFQGERTLAHELVHALQDRKFNISGSGGDGTRDGHNGYLGLIEGDANYVQTQYMDRCDGPWDCIDAPDDSEGPDGSDLHFGIYMLQFFPYSDGPSFVDYHRSRGGWEQVDDMFDDPPASAEQIAYPAKYGTDSPVDVELTDDTGGPWERLRPDPQREGSKRPDHARLGLSGLASMFIYTAYDDSNSTQLANPLNFLNVGGDGLNRSDPINYDFDFLTGWAGDRLHAYRNAETGETGYVWKLAWDSPGDAAAFADAYRDLLSYWRADRAGPTTYTIGEGSRFDGSYRVSVSGDTVTVVHAPSPDALGDVYGPAGS